MFSRDKPTVHPADNRAAFLETGALRRGLRIIAMLQARAPASLKPSEIAEQVGIPRPSVYRLLEVLVAEGAVQASVDGKRYSFGFGEIKSPGPGVPGLAATLRPMLRQVVARAKSSAFLIQRAGDDSLCVARISFGGPESIAPMPVGGRLPFGLGAASVALLATYSDEEVNETLARVAPRLYAHGRLSTGTVRCLVDQTKIRGYSVIGNYAVTGLLGLGRPLLGADGKAVAAVAVSSTIEKMNVREQRRIADILREECGDAGRIQ